MMTDNTNTDSGSADCSNVDSSRGYSREIRIPFIDLAPYNRNKQHQVCIVCAYNLQRKREQNNNNIIQSEREENLLKNLGQKSSFGH